MHFAVKCNPSSDHWKVPREYSRSNQTDLEKLQTSARLFPNVATGHSLEEAPRSSLPLGGGCLLGNSCFAIYILLVQLYPVASRGLLRERKTSLLHQGTGCHNPTPGWQGTRCKQSQCCRAQRKLLSALTQATFEASVAKEKPDS